MLKITNGRSNFWQWDIGQSLTVEGSQVTEVHIGNNKDNMYVVEPIDGIIAVYDELLQTGKPIVAYEYLKESEEGHTVNKYVFNVLKRPKADNYEYTPTVSHSWEWWTQRAKEYANQAQANAQTTEGNVRTSGENAQRSETALQNVINARDDALLQIGTKENTALESIENSKTEATSSINTLKTNSLEELDSARQGAITEVASTRDGVLASVNGAIGDAVVVEHNLSTAIDSANEVIGTANEVIGTAQGLASNLDTKLNEAVTTKSQLESAIDSAMSTKSILDEKNATANEKITALDSAILNSDEILTGVYDIKAYLGYTDDDIVGVQVDYRNKSFKRLAGAVGLSGGADFNVFKMFGGRKRCTVADDGTITSFYGDANYVEDGSIGQVMVYQPAFYYKVVPLDLEPQSDGVGFHLRKANYYVSNEPKRGFKLHPLFFDKNGTEVEYAMLSAFEGSVFDTSAMEYLLGDEQISDFNADKFCSISGAKPTSGKTQNLTRPNIELMAKNRGDGWHCDTIKSVSANQLLMSIELGTMNTQTAIGQGIVSVADNPNTENNSKPTGQTSSLGNTTGMASGTNGQVSVTYRGVENPWGNIWTFVYGINIYGNGSQKGGIPYICTDFNFAESKNSGNYESGGFTITNVRGYISAFGYSEEYDWLFLPSECVGNSLLPVGDYTYVSANLNGYRITRVGGYWADGGIAGGFCWVLNDWVGDRFRNFGGRLVYVPTKEELASYVENVNKWKAKM